jgi:hypothetical protein
LLVGAVMFIAVFIVSWRVGHVMSIYYE